MQIGCHKNCVFVQSQVIFAIPNAAIVNKKPGDRSAPFEGTYRHIEANTLVSAGLRPAAGVRIFERELRRRACGRERIFDSGVIPRFQKCGIGAAALLPCGCRLRRREKSAAAGEGTERRMNVQRLTFNAQLSSGEGEKRRRLNTER